MTRWLLDTLLATSGLMLLVLLLREPARRLFGSRVAYGLWLIPAARLFMPTLTHTVERTVPVQVPLQPLAVPLTSESLWMARVAPAPESFIDRLGGLPAIVIALWLGIALALFVSRMVAFRRDRRAILAASVGAVRLGSIRIVRTPEVVSPVALGIVRPIVAVPSDFERRYGPRERRLVLEHELAHHRSGDLTANLFAFVLLCLQWFNPLAWIAHAAFRFDQEAACDARVLDKGAAGDRGDYGRAIAKAASGKALLFASALDRRNTLKRRLQSMLRGSNPTRRLAGRLLVATAIAAALPLTASRAVDYVDVPAAPAPAAAAPAPIAGAARDAAFTPAAAEVSASAAPASALAASAPAAALSTAAAAASVVRAAPVSALAAAAPAAALTRAATLQLNVNGDRGLSISGDLVTIDGVTKRWEDLTPAEKVRVHDAVAKARAALANTHIDEAQIRRTLAAMPDPLRLAALQRELARTQTSVAESIRRMDEQAARDRAAGRDPDQLEAAIRATLQSLQAIDLSEASRALAHVNGQKIAADVAGAQQSMEAAKAELARLQARIDADQHR